MAIEMDAKIIITTSDAPPVALAVSQSALIAHSKVFGDMLSLELESDDAGGISIPLAETKAQLAPFFLMLEGREADLKKALSYATEKNWENFAKLADKYDSATARKIVEAKIWEVEARQESAFFAFTLATLIGDESSIRFTAVRAVRINDLSDPNFRAAHEWKERLAFWRTFHATKIFQTLSDYAKAIPQDCCSTSKQETWQKLSGAALALYDPRDTPPLPLSKCFDEHNHRCCSSCRKQVKATVEKFEKETSKWEPFPIQGLSFGTMGKNLLWKC